MKLVTINQPYFALTVSYKDKCTEEVNLKFLKSDVWLTVHRNSVWIRKTN